MPKGMLSDQDREGLRGEARTLVNQGVKLRRWVTSAAELHGVSVHTIYRAIEGVTPPRKKRADKGAMRAIEREAMADIAALTFRYEYDAQLALDTVNTARVQRGDAPYDVHVDTVRAHLRAMCVSRRQSREDTRIHRRWEAPYPQFLWQMDSTVAASWYIDTDNTIGYETPIALSKNKAGNGKPRIWLLSIVDDNSRVRWARYYTSNSAAAWRDMLIRAMRGFREARVWPARGVPERLYTDQDAAMKAVESVNFTRALDVELRMAGPSDEFWSESQAKGKVERTGGIIIAGFEVATKAKRFRDLETMNRALEKYLIWLNNRVHSETRAIPFERWITAPRITLLPDAAILRLESARQHTCKVYNDLSIRLERKRFQIPRRDPFLGLRSIGSVDVRYFRDDLSTIRLVIDGQVHEIAAAEAVADVAGEFHAAPETAETRTRKDLLARDLSHLDAAIHGVWDYRLERQGPRDYAIRPPEQEHPLTAAASAVLMIRRGPAVDRMRAAGVVSSPPNELDVAAIDALFAGAKQIAEPALVAWIAARRGATTGAAPLRAVERA